MKKDLGSITVEKSLASTTLYDGDGEVDDDDTSDSDIGEEVPQSLGSPTDEEEAAGEDRDYEFVVDEDVNIDAPILRKIILGDAASVIAGPAPPVSWTNCDWL
jgi:hypothetical protein